MDSEQMRMPGYRDRIVSVLLTPEQGGLNLNMSKELIGELIDYGHRAADLLLAAYARPPARGWAQQRAVRYHALMAMTERHLTSLRRAYDDRVQPATIPYQQIADGAAVSGADAGDQRTSSTSSASAGTALRWQRRRTEELMELARRWTGTDACAAAERGESFVVNEPTPAAVWRAQPEL
ncbi:hypothetical protein GTQ99_21205 [Kineococcus sp. T13]|nr:hypothetical protein [Kineococcus vitellinus]